MWPGRSTTGSPREQSMMVDSMPTLHGPPSRISGTRSPSSSATCSAVVGLMRPKRLADGAAMPGMLALGPGKAAQQFKRHRMAGHAQADGILAAGHGIGHPGLLLQDQGQRAGPEGFHQFPGDSGHLLGPMVDGIVAGQMDDQRVVGRPALGGEDLGHRRRVGGIRPQAVDRLGRDGDQFAGDQQVDGALIIRVGWRHQSLMPMAARAASAVFCTCSALSPITVKCPILRPGRAWCLP